VDQVSFDPSALCRRDRRTRTLSTRARASFHALGLAHFDVVLKGDHSAREIHGEQSSAQLRQRGVEGIEYIGADRAIL